MRLVSKFESPLNGYSGIGVTLGRFMPLHKGHELMIEMAAAELSELVVIVSDEFGQELPAPLPSLTQRFEIIRQKYAGWSNIRVVMHSDSYGPAQEYDLNGTAVDEEFWNYWINVVNILAPESKYIVTSDHYGAEMARRMKREWFPVDPNRELFPVSGTAIRKDPILNWKYISKEFRPYFAKKIVVIGAESSGKSTLVNDLAEYFNSPAVPEYGRILSEHRPDLDEDDFYDIVRRHEFMTQKACMESETGLVFVDTEKLVTWLYSIKYLDGGLDDIKRRTSGKEFDLWVLVPLNIPWVDDGTRLEDNQADREQFFNDLKSLTKQTIHQKRKGFKSFNRIILDETDRKRRVELVAEQVTRLVGFEQKHYTII